MFMETNSFSYNMKKTFFSAASLHDESDETTYWHSRPFQERMATLEFLRQVMFGYDPTTTRLQRVIEFAELETS